MVTITDLNRNFSFDDSCKYLTNSAYFISGKNLKYLLAVLKSIVSDFYFFQITAQIAGAEKDIQNNM